MIKIRDVPFELLQCAHQAWGIARGENDSITTFSKFWTWVYAVADYYRNTHAFSGCKGRLTQLIESRAGPQRHTNQKSTVRKMY